MFDGRSTQSPANLRSLITHTEATELSLQRVAVMNTGLWIVQIVLALVFLITGGLKLMLPSDKVAERMGNEKGFSPRTMRIIGLLEVMGAIGVILPAWTGILPWLTPLAAAGLMLTMIGAAFENVRNRHFPMIVVNFVIGALAMFVIYGRFIVVRA
jgi:uncharacterized membrane protein YphA (DoxX/SURF4 family)